MEKLADISMFEALNEAGNASFNAVFNKDAKKRKEESRRSSKANLGIALLGGALGAAVSKFAVRGLIDSGLLSPESAMGGALGAGGRLLSSLLLATFLRKHLDRKKAKADKLAEVERLNGVMPEEVADDVDWADGVDSANKSAGTKGTAYAAAPGSTGAYDPSGVYRGQAELDGLADTADHMSREAERLALETSDSAGQAIDRAVAASEMAAEEAQRSASELENTLFDGIF